MNRMPFIEEGWSCLFRWGRNAVYIKLNKGNNLVVSAVTGTT